MFYTTDKANVNLRILPAGLSFINKNSKINMYKQPVLSITLYLFTDKYFIIKN